MFELLPEMPLPAKFFVAFVVVLALIALTAWLVRRLGANRLGGGATRGRQPRLAVIDAASVDGRRRLVLIRRDNIEHLLMIGGPTDVVVEQNIVRASGASRETGRMAGDGLPRTMPLGDNNGWPLQPSVEIAPAPAMPPASPPVQQQTALRATRVTPAEDAWTPPPEPPRPRAAPPVTPVPPAPQPDLSARFTAPDLNIPPPPPLPEPAAIEPTLPAEPAHPPQSDRNLAEMAQRLEAALRRPAAETKAAEVKAAAPDPFSVPVPSSPRAPEPPRSAPRDSAASGEKPASSSKTPFDSLEQEMANLLGRPANKT
ncbi:MAG: flagellar biosynthetic protein FliO [Xanthobacteraceae bacterium]|uniref:FliO/MopB family protein n=1 Tax=Pseudolabrys sp. TaxID=1960880 RepID=UPI003D12DBAC